MKAGGGGVGNSFCMDVSSMFGQTFPGYSDLGFYVSYFSFMLVMMLAANLYCKNGKSHRMQSRGTIAQ